MSAIEEQDNNPQQWMKEAAEAEKKERDPKRGHRMLGGFLNLYLRSPLPLKIVFLLLGMLYSPAMVQNLIACLRAPKIGTLRVISGPEFIYIYPMAIWGLIFCGIDRYLETQALNAPLVWLYLGLVLFTVITMGLDFRGGSWLGVIIVVIAIVAAVGWWGEKNHVPILSLVGDAIAWFHLERIPREFVFTLSVLLLVIYLGVWIRMNLVDVLKIEGNYVQVWTFASRSPKDTRASFSLVPDFDDLNEVLLGFSCRLTLKSKSPRVQSHDFVNMPGGPVVEHIATHLLNAQEVEVRNDPFAETGTEGDDE